MMRLRTPGCKGSPDEIADAHGPHECRPVHWYMPWVNCAGWTESEATATAAVKHVLDYVTTTSRLSTDGRLEASTDVLFGISRLIEGIDVPGFPLTALFGVPIKEADLGPGGYRLVQA